jgi:hypothetical protein
MPTCSLTMFQNVNLLCISLVLMRKRYYGVWIKWFAEFGKVVKLTDATSYCKHLFCGWTSQMP